MSHRAVIVIDVQNEYDNGALPIAFPPFGDALERITTVMDAAEAAAIPVVVVQQDFPAGSPAFAVGSPGWKLHPRVARRAAALRLRKLLPGAFTGTELDEWLRARGVDTLTIVGFMTQHCVDSTARQARHRGYSVEVLSDATGAVAYSNAAGAVPAETLHQVHLIALHADIAAVATTDEWLEAAGEDRPLPIDNPIASAAAALAGAR